MTTVAVFKHVPQRCWKPYYGKYAPEARLRYKVTVRRALG